MENLKDYKQIIQTIRNLNWENLSVDELQTLMILSAYAAREFAESLRIALEFHPESAEFKEMAEGELQTNNLKFDTYDKCGDHADFLWHFIDKYGLENLYPEAIKSGEEYLLEIRKLDKKIRVMSIISREQELPGIFKRILEAQDWSTPVLQAFRYYLEEHIHLDSMEGGHGDLLAHFIVNDNVAAFYDTRLAMYHCMPKLFL